MKPVLGSTRGRFTPSKSTLGYTPDKLSGGNCGSSGSDGSHSSSSSNTNWNLYLM
jgi:hypothetical protein